jgi:ribose 5-phosphate isomerase A
MVEFLKKENLNIQLYTSSGSTKNILEQSHFIVNDFSEIHSLDIYLDGCDQLDKNLNALKSGSGIHTTEKLLASMAKQFILIGDESKYAEELETKFPLVVEVIPEAATFAQYKIKELFPDAKIETRYKNNAPVITKYSNQLIDIWFNDFPELSILNFLLKNITGVLETSLFYNLASKAIIAGTDRIRILERINPEQ